MINYIFPLLFIALIAGCSNKPISLEEARGIPELHVFQRNLLQPKEGFAEITFLRDTGILDSPLFYQLYMNDKRLAAIDPGEKLTIWVEPGIYAFGVRTSERWNPPEIPSTWYLRRLEIDARPDRQYRVRIGYNIGRDFVFESISSPKTR